MEGSALEFGFLSAAPGPFGQVWVDVDNGPTEWIFNTPNTGVPVFPAEQVGIGLRPESLEIARRTVETIRLEGGNDLVFQPLMRARLGILDLDWFKSEVRYCLLPNGIANDRARQAGGRYSDQTDFDFMMRMAVWVENFSLPAVINDACCKATMVPSGFSQTAADGAGPISRPPRGRGVSGERFVEWKDCLAHRTVERKGNNGAHFKSMGECDAPDHAPQRWNRGQESDRGRECRDLRDSAAGALSD